MTKMKSFRLKDVTRLRIRWLKTQMGVTETEVIELAIAKWCNEVNAPSPYELLTQYDL